MIIEESNQYQTQRGTWNGEFLGGVVFEPGFRMGGDGSFPQLNYTIRLGPEFGSFTELFTLLLFPAFQLPGPGFSGVFYEEFIKFQNMIDLAYIEILTGETLLPESVTDFENVEYVSWSISFSKIVGSIYLFYNFR